jgi:dienelactone hydrolase
MTMTLGEHPSQDNAAPVAVEMGPLAFHGLSGWLHQRQGVCADTGVVLISPLGRDERCAHMPMRLFADRLAAAGYPALRYDHLGEGDSLDLPDPDEDALVHWMRGIDQAIARLRAQAGVSRVVLGGVRLGASFAALAAQRADGLILLAPVLSGRSWLRRARFSSGVVESDAQEQGDVGALDTDGLNLSAATVRALSEIELSSVSMPVLPVFVAAQNKLVAGYAAALARQAPRTPRSDFPGFDALFLDAHSNLPPTLVFDRVAHWLEAEFPGLASRPIQARAVPAAAIEPLRPPGASEHPVTFGGGLRGVLCQPDAPLAGAPAVLFFNTGGDPRCGIGGFATRAARALAARSVASLRFDFAGLGDSPMPAGGQARSHIFETPRAADLDAAVDLLAGRGHQTIVAAGVCAGAYHGFKLAMHDPRVAGLFAISPVKLVWRTGDTLAFGKQPQGKATHFYARALTELHTWKRLLASDVDVGVIARTVMHRLRGRARGLFGESPLRAAEDFARRGGRACFLMGLDDASLDEMETYFGFRAAKLKRLPHTTVHITPNLDHGLARSASRELALAMLLTWLEPNLAGDR